MYTSNDNYVVMIVLATSIVHKVQHFKRVKVGYCFKFYVSWRSLLLASLNQLHARFFLKDKVESSWEKKSLRGGLNLCLKAVTTLRLAS